MPGVIVQHQGVDPNDLLFISPQFIGILIKNQDTSILSIEWLSKKDGPCPRELSTEAEAKEDDRVGKEKGKYEEMMEQQCLADQK